jgi:hypothetical protein
MTEHVFERVPIAIEGRPTVDGRLIEVGALWWVEAPVPVLGKAPARGKIGWASKFERPKGFPSVVCEVHITHGLTRPLRAGDLTVECLPDPKVGLDIADDGTIVVHSALIRALALTGAWPW